MAKIVFGKKCPVCNGVLARRMKRNWWMRLIPGSMKYYCGKCYHDIWYFMGMSLKIGKRHRK